MGKNDLTTGEFREKLLDCFDKAMAGDLTNDQIKGIIGTSNQINSNLAAEIRLRQFELKAGNAISEIGNIRLGHHAPDGIPTKAATIAKTEAVATPEPAKPKRRGRPRKV